MRFYIPEEAKVLLTITCGLFVLGTAVYHWVERLSWLDALYLSVITLATVGYGDITPVTSVGKLFTIVYVLAGVGVLVSFVSMLSHHFIERRMDVRLERRSRRTQRENAP